MASEGQLRSAKAEAKMVKGQKKAMRITVKEKRQRKVEEEWGGPKNVWPDTSGPPLNDQTKRSHFKLCREERPVGFAKKQRETDRSSAPRTSGMELFCLTSERRAGAV
ncbi:hypothetical protein L596_024685 [Steinernema carpocapsae]|uniref:Uncharacterized protein n=1 Tax=Steinernema carpocapsae TaxID=34508 RepID=A0A4V5ZYJ4_STECR|nr:hypothetical protein L596_024685 [Steinernema carpocapsae]